MSPPYTLHCESPYQTRALLASRHRRLIQTYSLYFLHHTRPSPSLISVDKEVRSRQFLLVVLERVHLVDSRSADHVSSFLLKSNTVLELAY